LKFRKSARRDGRRVGIFKSASEREQVKRIDLAYEHRTLIGVVWLIDSLALVNILLT
jgi:hypothetical protein